MQIEISFSNAMSLKSFVFEKFYKHMQISHLIIDHGFLFTSFWDFYIFEISRSFAALKLLFTSYSEERFNIAEIFPRSEFENVSDRCFKTMVCPLIGAILTIRLWYAKHNFIVTVCLLECLFTIHFSEGNYVCCRGETYGGERSELGLWSKRSLQTIPTFGRQGTG